MSGLTSRVNIRICYRRNSTFKLVDLWLKAAVFPLFHFEFAEDRRGASRIDGSSRSQAKPPSFQQACN